MGKLIDYINNNLSLEEEYKEIFGHSLPSGKFICPNPSHVHKNNTPSCKAYGNKFKCFGQCNQVFGVYDLLKWHNPKKIEDIKTSVILTTPVDSVSHKPNYHKINTQGLSLEQVILTLSKLCSNIKKL